MNTTPTLLVVTPTLGESVFLEQTLASVAALPVPVLHVLSVPAAKVTLLQARYPHLKVVPDAGKAGAIYGAINAALFAHLRAADRSAPTAIAVAPFPETGLGEAINDRLRRAAGFVG